MSDDAPTVDSIRDDLRGAFFNILFFGGPAILELGAIQEQEHKNAMCTVQNLVIFGVNAKLLTNEEANEWMDVISKKQLLPTVASKYMKGHEEVSDDPEDGTAEGT